MGHSSDMSNRIKMNDALKSKSNKFRKAYFNQTVIGTKSFQFKDPTELDLIQTKKSNLKFIEARKKRSMISFVFSLLVSFVAMYFLVELILRSFSFRIY